VDDWTYISYKRLPIPLLNAWNPGKVFPEIYMPLMGNSGAFLIYPITGDYLRSITLTLGFGAALIVVLYIECFRRLLMKKTGISDLGSILPTLLFFLLHLTIFISNEQVNKYLLGGVIPTNTYNYTLPSLLNFSVIFIFESMDSIGEFLRKRKVIQVGLLFIMIYFAIFSNLYCNILLATYSFAKLLLDFATCKQKYSGFIKRSIPYCFILFLWVVSLQIEFRGGRADSIMQDSKVSELIISNAYIGLDSFFLMAKDINRLCFLICVLVTAATIILIFRNRKSREENSADVAVFQINVIAAICTVLSIVYLYLLCLVARPNYYNESFVWVAFLPWLFITTVIGLSFLQTKYRTAAFLTPLVLCIIIIVCGRYIGTLEENTVHNLPPDKCRALNTYLMDQIVAADKNEQSEMVLILPVANRANYVTFSAPFHGERIARTMYWHRLVHRQIKVDLEHRYEINEMFRLNEEMEPM
jgi:hypothetical protein